MPRPVHLVGSVPLNSAEAVMATCCSVLGNQLSRVPDGETGIRTNWIHWQRNILGSHPAIEVVGKRKNAETTMPRFSIADGFVGDIKFTELGYLSSALESYEKFKHLRNEGKIGRQRFQVCLPTPLAAVACYVEQGSQEAIYPGYMECLFRETSEIIEKIPHEDLAVQWDVAIEFAILEGLFPVWFDRPFEVIARNLEQLAHLIPASVEVGFHFCYGDSGNKHFKEPVDMSLMVSLSNQVTRSVIRNIDWLHMPVPIDRTDADYFEALRDLNQSKIKQVFLGLLHENDGIQGAERRMETADCFIENYGIATECGMGRRKTETIPRLLELHSKIWDL